ncbi:uncharacterized protein FOMMEDRAFT_20078 [Fomitiporia mediterranea MF3/22]|uniref:uncharacterized protein n=1 Tax=Fomitiporia mediterranea (strain MF3/22) TaxID=694068 RepID=UPI0004409772|nr:uncharacterized protein FOMMEDRAFT_20078 [Fomitiporia mediterranea MF3/22]EJD02831.1 hypothetical protein FOMMEDRAFT_20078 [Fomitiporia mediterranea MF3/22]
MSGFRPLQPSTFSRFSALFQLRSMLLSVVVFFVLLVLAYLTNPSETSFRAFLTEQAFRHHLSRLDDADTQDELESAGSSTKTDALYRRGPSSFHKNRSITAISSPPFPFASRASVSLRTPKHIFRSFGIFSIAAVVPTSSSHRSSPIRGQRGDESATRTDRDGASNASTALISDSWFIGAFGMWFWAVNLDGLWKDAGLIEKDEADGTITGVLEIKALDRSDDSNRSSHAQYGNGNLNHGQRTSPKLRSRERFAHQNGNALSHRSQTPPPLPKSASLPLHTKRGSHTLQSDKALNGGPNSHHSNNNSFTDPSVPSGVIQPPISITPEFCSVNATSLPVLAPSSTPSASPSRSPSTLFASSPLIAEILRQISSSQSAISDLHAQLRDFNASSTQARNALDDELARQRERKRADDAAKAELKAHTKTLEDQKRSTEAARRDAEKRLRAAQSERGKAEARIERSEREINTLQTQMEAHGAAIVSSGVETGALVTDLQEQIEEKRSEVRTVEDELAQLSSQLREMEEKVSDEEHRLEVAKAEADERRQKSNAAYLYSQHTSYGDRSLLTYTNGSNTGASYQFPQLQVKPSEGKFTDKMDVQPSSPIRKSIPDSPLSTAPAEAHTYHVSRPGPPIPTPLDANLANGYSPFNLDFGSHRPNRNSLPHKFAPFSSELASPGPISPTGESLLPSSLYESLGMAIPINTDSPVSATSMDISRSFQSEDDAVLDRNWPVHRKLSVGDVGQPVMFPSSSPGVHTSPVSPAASTYSPDTLEAYEMGQKVRERTTSQPMDLQRATFPSRSSGASFALRQALIPYAYDDHVEAAADTSGRRSGWFASHKDKCSKTSPEKKGLNPDAKEFSLSKDKERSFSALLSRSRGSGHSSSSGTSSTPSSASLSTPDSSSLVSSPSLSSATTVKNGSPQGQSTPAAAPRTTTAASLLGFGSSWFGGSSRAFAPTPLEREQLSRALGGTANSSLDKLDGFPSLPISPQSKPALVHSNSQAPTRPWDTNVAFGLRVNGSKGFSPFEDDEPKVTSLHSGSGSSSEESAESSKEGSH